MTIIYRFLIAIFPVAVLMWFVYRKGDGKNIPVKQLKWAFGLGVLSAFIASFLADGLEIIGLYSPNPSTTMEILLHELFIAAFPEELAKMGMFCLLLKLYPCEKRIHMIVCMAFIGLGFACIENMLYVIPQGIGVGVMRAIFSVPDHFCYAIIMGYFFSYARFSSNGKWKYYVVSLLLPMCFHWLNNSLVVPKGTENWGWYFCIHLVEVILLLKWANWMIKNAKESEEQTFFV